MNFSTNMRRLAVLLFALLAGTGASWGQSVQNFGTSAASQTSQTGSTTFIPAPTVSGTTYARAGATAPASPIVLATTSNPLSTTGAYVRAVASSSGSVSTFSPMLNITSPSTAFYYKATMLLGNSTGGSTSATSGTWNLYIGNGAMFGDNNDFTTAQIFAQLQFVFGASGALTFNYRNASGLAAVPATVLTQGTVYTFEIVGNNATSGTVNYTYNGGAQSVASDRFDLYVNGTLINELVSGTLPAGTNVEDTDFVGINSTSNVANLFVDDVSFQTSIPASIGGTAPTVTTTNSATGLSTSTATVGGGNVTAAGTPATVTARGIVYGTAAAPTGNQTPNGSGTGVFTAVNLTGLTSNTLYTYRAYATNGLLGYGADQNFTTLGDVTNGTVTSLTESSTTISNSVIAAGGGATITARGVVYSQSTTIPTLVDAVVVNGSGTGTYSTNLTGLTANRVYYYRSYATNAGGTSYSASGSFTTLPAVITGTAGSITATTATISTSNISVPGAPIITGRGIVWSSTDATPTIGEGGVTNVTSGTGAGNFNTNLTGLPASTLIYYTAYATNAGGTNYGSVSSFTTDVAATASFTLTDEPSGGPTLSHGSSCVSVAATSRTYRITNSGGAAGTPTSVTSDNGQFVVSGFTSSSLAASGGFTTFVVTFTPTGAGAQNATITVAGANSPTLAVTGTGTAAVAAVVSTSAETNILATSARLNGNYSTAPVCNPAIIEKGFVYSPTATNANPLVLGAGVTKQDVAGTATGTYLFDLTGLAASTGYSYKAYIYDGTTYTYGAVETFTTSNPTVSLSLSGTTGTEAAATVITVTATASQAVVGNQTVNLAVTGTGITAGDYTLSNTTITILNGQTTGTVTFTVVDDAATEGTETATLTISSPSAGLTLGTPLTGNVAITDNDGPCIDDASGYTGWTLTGVAAATNQACSGSGLLFTGSGQTAVTPSIVNPNKLNFTKKRSGNTDPWELVVEISTSPSGPWTVVSTITTITASCAANAEIDLTAYTGTQYLRFRDNRASGAPQRGIDDITVTCLPAGPLLSITGQATGSTYPYGNLETGTFADRVFTLSNTGSAPLSISDISLGDNSVGNGYTITAGLPLTSIAAGSSANVTVRFAPTDIGVLKTNTFDVTSNAGNVTNPYTVNLTGTGTPSAQSDIANFFTPNATVEYDRYQATGITNTNIDDNDANGGSYGLLRFDIRDGGGVADLDNLPTILDDVTFTVNNASAIRMAALFSTANAKLNVSNPVINTALNTITFTNLPVASFTAADNGTLQIWLRVSFTGTVIDNQAITVTLTNASVVQAAGNTSSGFKTFGPTVSSGTANRIFVSGTQIGFSVQPVAASTVGVNSSFTVAIQYQDFLGNRDTDFAGNNVSITRLAGTGTLTGTTSGAFTAGLFTTTSLQLNAIETGVTLQVVTTSPALNTIVSNSFNVGGVGYTVGDYRTKSGTTDWTTASNWEVLQANGVTWTTATSAPDNSTQVVHVERSLTLDNYSGANLRTRANKVYVKNGATLTIAADGDKGLVLVGNDAELRILDNSTVIADDFIDFNNTPTQGSAGLVDPTTGKLTVDSTGRLIINFECYNRALIWNGVENFKGGSTVEIENWDWNGNVSTTTGNENRLVDEVVQVTRPRNITNNAQGYKFGNLDISALGMTEAFILVSGSPTVKLCKNNLIIRTGDFANSVIGSNSKAVITYGGLDVQTGEFAFFSTSGIAPNADITATVEKDLRISGNGSVNLNQTISGNVNPIITLRGNYINLSTGDISSTDAAAQIRFDGGKLHTIEQSTTFATPNANIGWVVTGGDSARIKTQNWALSTNTTVTVQSGGTFDFSGTAATPFRITEFPVAATGTSFVVETGGTAIVTDNAGIMASGATGNVQTDTRTYNAAGNYHYKPVATGTVSVGTGLASTLTGIVTWEGLTNAQVLNFVNGTTTITSPGKLYIKKGALNENTASPENIVTGTGGLEMEDGVYSLFRPLGASVPRLSGTYALTGGTVALSATVTTVDGQTLRGETYHNVAFNGTATGVGSKTVSSATTINNQLSIGAGELVDIANRGISGDGGLTMSGGLLRISKISNPQPELTGLNQTYSITGGTIEFYGTSATQQQNIRGGFTYNNITVAGTVANRTAGNVDLESSLSFTGLFLVKSPSYLNLDASDALSGTGNFQMETGTGLRFANANGIKSSGTGTSDGNLRISGTRTLPAQATYVAAGGATSAVFGNGIPANADTIVVARSANAIATTGNLSVAHKLRFATASNIITGADSVILQPTASLVGEASDRFINGYVKAYRTVAQTTPNTFGGIGLTVEALGAAPGYSIATRRTGAAAIRTGYVGNVSIARYYDITAATNTGLNARLTFQYFDTELNGLPETQLTAYRSQDAGVTWTEYNATARNDVNNFVIVQNIPGFSQWALANYDDPLPVDLVTFKGHVESKAAVLEWRTANEVRNAGFEVQRSVDGRTFTKIGFVAAKANARAGAYSYVDAGFTGNAYYRLRQVDVDGASTVSQSIYLTTQKAAGVAQLAPMPATGKLTLTWLGQEEQAVTARLLSVDGKEIFTATGSLDELSATLTERLAEQASGMYQLQLKASSGSQVLRIVK